MIPAISTENLTRRFGDLTAVDRLSLTVPRGIIFGFLGPNGAGKSTTINMLTSLLPPTAGTATVSGFDIIQDPLEVKRRIGVVPEGLNLSKLLKGQIGLDILDIGIDAIKKQTGEEKGEKKDEEKGALDEAIDELFKGIRKKK